MTPLMTENPPSPTTRKQWALLFGVVAVLLIADQITKALVVANLALYETWEPIPALRSVFNITYTQNTGAAFGLLPSASNFFLVVAIIASGVIIYYYRQIKEPAPFVRVALGLQLGGALGNAIDRITRGFVVDFLHIFYEPLGFDYPIFNLADAAIVIGVLVLVVLFSFEKQPEPADNL